MKLIECREFLDGSLIEVKTYERRTVKAIVDFAGKILRNRPYFGNYRVVRADGKWASYREVAHAYGSGKEIEWSKP